MLGLFNGETREYWYYSNHAYELRTVTPAGGGTEQQQRSIHGPCPQQDVLRVVQGNLRINPATPNWRERIVQRLQGQQFEVKQINNSPPNREIGMTKKGYVLDPEARWNFGVGVVKVTGVALFYFSPSLTAKYLPSAARSLGIAAAEESGLMGAVRHSWTAWRGAAAGLLGGAVVGGITIVGGNILYDALVENLVPAKHFREWRRNQINILTERNNSPFRDILNSNPELYERIEDDPVLGNQDNICPITQQPIRYPVRTPAGHVFEEQAIKAWLTRRSQEKRPLTNPANPAEILTHAGLVFDDDLSDTIELRLLALKSFYE